MSQQTTTEQTRKGRPPEGERPRVTVSATVDAQTDDRLNEWLEAMREASPGKVVKVGRVVDAMREHCERTEFKP